MDLKTCNVEAEGSMAFNETEFPGKDIDWSWMDREVGDEKWSAFEDHYLTPGR